MSEAERRRAKADVLAQAIQAYMAGEGLSEGMLGDWVVIGTNVYVDEYGDPDAEYFVAMTNGTMLQHTALGLIKRGEMVLLGQNPASGEEEE